jgi:hypothetical protein
MEVYTDINSCNDARNYFDKVFGWITFVELIVLCILIVAYTKSIKH